MSKGVLLVPLACLVAVAVGCQPLSEEARRKRDEADRKAQQAAQARREATRQEIEDYRKKAQKELDDLDVQLRDLKDRAAKASGELKAKLQKKIDDLEPQRDRVRARLKQLGEDSKKA